MVPDSWLVQSFRQRGRGVQRKSREENGAEKELKEMSCSWETLPYDVIIGICGRMRMSELYAASGVCRSWREALAPLREGMLLVQQGKRLKHHPVHPDLHMALQSFLDAVRSGSSPAMVHAGLLLWNMGRKEQGIELYRAAAELGDPAGQCNLGISYLQSKPSNYKEAVKWFYRASFAGHVRAQYSLALCLQQGRGVERNPVKAAKWYLRAAEGGGTRAMYNTALCYLSGEGIARNYQEARKWMKRAALAGHRKAQFEHGLTLFALSKSEGDGVSALIFLELATRAGETAATHIRDVLLQKLSPKLRAHAITRADNWQIKKASR